MCPKVLEIEHLRDGFGVVVPSPLDGALCTSLVDRCEFHSGSRRDNDYRLALPDIAPLDSILHSSNSDAGLWTHEETISCCRMHAALQCLFGHALHHTV